MKKVKSVLSIILLMLFFMTNHALACVGKTIAIGTKDGSDVQRIVDEIIAVLINERTGTSVKIVNYDNPEDCRKAIISAEIDIYVEYTGSALTEVLNSKDVMDSAKTFDFVKDNYNEKFNLIWLSPYGFEYKDGLKREFADSGIPADAAPVVRKDTLKKFPALARLLQKLEGKLTNGKLDGLLKMIKGDNHKQVARDFLKESKLI